MRKLFAHAIITSGLLGATIICAACADVTSDEVAACAAFPKGTTQTPAGVCIDGVLFKSVLDRLTKLENFAVSPTTPQGKTEH